MTRMTLEWATERLAEIKTHLAEARAHYQEHCDECGVCVFGTGPWCKTGLFRHANWCRESAELRDFARKAARIPH